MLCGFKGFIILQFRGLNDLNTVFEYFTVKRHVYSKGIIEHINPHVSDPYIRASV